jgi:predicted glutamine amidotransferase
MCRWLAYTGDPVLLERLLFEPQHSLIEQSLHAEYSEITTNGDGFGVGWYGDRAEPGLFKDVRPAWNDPNLRDLARHIRGRLLLAHVRATTGSEIQRSNCHPFRWRRWLFMHNGSIREYPKLRRDLALAISEDLFSCLGGTTDSEVMFYLALTFGLERDPVRAVERMIAKVEDVAERHGVADPLQMTVCVSEGERLLAFRYASSGEPRTLYLGADADCLSDLTPAASRFSRNARVIVSEPFGGVGEAWEEVPPSSAVIVAGDTVERRELEPGPRG